MSIELTWNDEGKRTEFVIRARVTVKQGLTNEYLDAQKEHEEIRSLADAIAKVCASQVQKELEREISTELLRILTWRASKNNSPLSWNVIYELCGKLPELFNKKFSCPEGCLQENLSDVIIHLNDQHEWSRERIADWLETLDVDLVFKGEVNGSNSQ